MSVHKLTEEALARATHEAYVNAVWNAVGLLVASLFLIWKLHSRWTVLFGIGPVLLIFVWNATRRAEKLYSTYGIGVDDTGIWRQYRHRTQEQISFKDLGQVLEVLGEGMLIRSADGSERIAVSGGISGYDSVREKIASMVGIERTPRRRVRVHLPVTPLIGVTTLIAFVTFFSTEDPLIAGALGVVVITGLGTVVFLRRVGLSFGRIAAAMLAIAVAAAIAVRVYLTLTAGGWPAE